MFIKQTKGYLATYVHTKQGDQEIMFAVSPAPKEIKIPGVGEGDYVAVSLLNLSNRNYFLEAGGPTLGWEYIAEKFRLNEKDAIFFTKVLSNILGRESRIPLNYLNYRKLKLVK